MAGLSHARVGSWDRTDLTRRLCHALETAERAIDRLGEHGYIDAEEPCNTIRPEKLISETAFLLYAASQISSSHGMRDVKVKVDRVAKRLLPHARSERLLLGLCLEPTLVWDYAQAHVCLRSLGYGDVETDTLLRQTLRAHVHCGRERTPHRQLEQEWIASMWRGARLRNGHSAAALTSALNLPMDVLSGSREDVYAFTHAVMYTSDFNRYPHRLPRARHVILAEAEAMLARCLDDQDYDLAGEVLLTWPLTGKTWTPAAVFGFGVLMRIEDEAGFLPSAATRLDRLSKLEGNARTDYLLAAAYHTAYVMGLLCATALQPGRTPPKAICARTTWRGSSNALMAHFASDVPRCHWQDDFDLLSDDDKGAITSLLLTVALRRMIKQRDFGAVQLLLQRAHASGSADTVAARQAQELLVRLAAFAERRERFIRSGAHPKNDATVRMLSGRTRRTRKVQTDRRYAGPRS
jgi:hypothetical protein